MVRLEQRTFIQAPIERCFHLARSVEVHLLGNTHWGERAVASGGVTSGLINLGQSVTWRAKHFFVWHTLLSQITAYKQPHYFRDEMLRGPFRSMVHHHRFTALSPNETLMVDIFTFEAPIQPLGKLVEGALLRNYMSNLLRERNNVIRDVAESNAWRRYLPPSTSAA